MTTTPSKQWIVYELYDDQGELIYIGMTGNWKARRSQHRGAGRVFDDTRTVTRPFATKEEAAACERETIHRLRPPLNKGPSELVNADVKVTIPVYPEQSAHLRKHAESLHMTIGAYIRTLIEKDMLEHA